jgi:hypothetical protein
MQSEPPCEHDWSLIYEEETWSGPKRLSICFRCRATLREWLPHSPGATPQIPLPRPGNHRVETRTTAATRAG